MTRLWTHINACFVNVKICVTREQNIHVFDDISPHLAKAFGMCAFSSQYFSLALFALFALFAHILLLLVCPITYATVVKCMAVSVVL